MKRWDEVRGRVSLIVLASVLVLGGGCGRQTDPTLVGNAGGFYGTVRWSPDGKWIGFLYNREVWVSDTRGKHARRLTSSFWSKDSITANVLTWTPDSRLVYAVSHTSDFTANVTLYARSPATGGVDTLYSGLNPVSSVLWNPESSSLAAVISSASSDLTKPGTRQLLRLDMDKRELTPILSVSANATVEAARWFPDGKRLAFVQRHTINVAGAEGGVSTCHYDSGNVGSGAISPDGKWILYRRIPTSSNSYRGSMWIMLADCSEEPTHLSDIDMVEFDWSPDGSSVIYTTVGEPGRNQMRLFLVPTQFRMHQ